MNLMRVMPSKGARMSQPRVLSSSKLGWVWFGAAVSLAEILTGTFFAPLGFEMGIAAILVGHVIGCALFYLVGFVSAKTGESAMEVANRSFGRFGADAFSIANVIQLIGWTAIMIMSGATAATLLMPQLGVAGWSVIIGALIVLWIAIGMKKMGTVQSIAAIVLVALTFAVSFAVFGDSTKASAVSAENLSFGAAIELAAAMPLSWLPVAGDYLCTAKRPVAGTTLATGAYFIGSCWMFAIGLGCALFAGSDDVATVLAQSGMGAVGILVVVISTVTTTFLDAQSAGVSAESIHPRLHARVCGIAAAVIGCVLAIVAPVGDFEGFLYLIGSVFAPMATIVCVNYFVLHRNRAGVRIDWHNVVLWLLGFGLYRLSLDWVLPCGNTLPVMAIIAITAVVIDVIERKMRRQCA